MTRMNDVYVPEFEQFVKDVMESYDAAGAAVSIFVQDKTHYENFFGWRDAENRLPITPDTLFGMASISKSFTVIALLQLVEKGLVDLDGPVSDYVPGFTGKNQKGVKVAHLLSHSAGFFPEPRILAKDVAEEIGIFGEAQRLQEDITYSAALAEEGAKRVAARLDSRTEHVGRPGELMSYSNDGYGLIADIVRQRGGELSFSRYVARHILEPLEMTRSHLEFESPKLDGNCTQLYIHRNGRRESSRDFYDNAFVLMGGGAMRSTVNDMKKYVRMLINEGRGENGTRVLGEYYAREMRKPVQFYRYQQYYGYGLATRFMDDITVVGHGGGLTGVANMMLFSPELEAGALVFCNTTNVPAAAVGSAAMRLLNGKKPLQDPDFVDTPWTAETVEAACGSYKSGEGSLLEIYKKGESVGLRIDGEEKAVRTTHKDMLVVMEPYTLFDLILCRRGGVVMGVRFGGRVIPRRAEPSV